jgi:hypothetical protein
MPRDASDGFALPLGAVQNSFKYRVVAGSVTSPTYQVTVARAPRVTRIDIDYTYPLDPGLLPRHEEDSGDIYAQNVNIDGSLGVPSTCTISTYCVGAPNSVGPGASIGMEGSTSVALNDLLLTASGCPPHKSAIFLYGSTQVQVPLGDGFRCVGGTLKRLRPATSTDALGNFSRHADYTQPPMNSGAGQILPGSTWNFQLYYRDTGGSGINLSNGMQASFCP